jgi:hypothetical protein
MTARQMRLNSHHVVSSVPCGSQYSVNLPVDKNKVPIMHASQGVLLAKYSAGNVLDYESQQ